MEGGFLIYLGKLDESERLKIIVKFYENRYINGLHISRSLVKAEKELKRITWIRADIKLLMFQKPFSIRMWKKENFCT